MSTLQAGVPSSITSNVVSVFGLLTGTVVTKLQLYTQGANSYHECSPGKPPSTTVFHTSGCGDP